MCTYLPSHTQRDWHMAQQEIITQLLPVFITSHPAYTQLLHEAWHGAVSITKGLMVFQDVSKR